MTQNQSPHESNRAAVSVPAVQGQQRQGSPTEITHEPGVQGGAGVSGGNEHKENMQLPLGRFTSVTFSILQSRRENGVGGRLKIALLKGFLLKWVPTL